MKAPGYPRFDHSALLQFGEALLVNSGLLNDRAHDVAEVLLEGDLLGHTTHGFALLPAYLNALAEGSMEKRGEPRALADHGSALTWDGRYLPGPWLMRHAISIARERLRDHPVVTFVLQRSHHIGCLEAYLKPVTDEGLLILLTCSDPQSRTVAPHGGTVAQYSPNPIAVGIPTRGEPILIDISMSATSNGLCQRLAAAGERLPGRWLINREGQPTDDPGVLFDANGGTILPLGGVDLGYKGFALGLIVEALTNALGGHGRATGETRWGASVFLQLIHPAAFGGMESFLRETSFLSEACAQTPARSGQPPVRLPGHAALARRAKQLSHGVELHPTILPALEPWADTLKVKVPPSL